jgi:hypothetical protein
VLVSWLLEMMQMVLVSWLLEMIQLSRQTSWMMSRHQFHSQQRKFP